VEMKAGFVGVSYVAGLRRNEDIFYCDAPTAAATRSAKQESVGNFFRIPF